MSFVCLYFNTQGYVPRCWRISLVCLAVKLVGSWVELGFNVGMEALGELLLINGPWSQEISGDLKFWI